MSWKNRFLRFFQRLFSRRKQKVECLQDDISGIKMPVFSAGTIGDFDNQTPQRDNTPIEQINNRASRFAVFYPAIVNKYSRSKEQIVPVVYPSKIRVATTEFVIPNVFKPYNWNRIEKHKKGFGSDCKETHNQQKTIESNVKLFVTENADKIQQANNEMILSESIFKIEKYIRRKELESALDEINKVIQNIGYEIDRCANCDIFIDVSQRCRRMIQEK